MVEMHNYLFWFSVRRVESERHSKEDCGGDVARLERLQEVRVGPRHSQTSEQGLEGVVRSGSHNRRLPRHSLDHGFARRIRRGTRMGWTQPQVPNVSKCSHVRNRHSRTWRTFIRLSSLRWQNVPRKSSKSLVIYYNFSIFYHQLVFVAFYFV